MIVKNKSDIIKIISKLIYAHDLREEYMDSINRIALNESGRYRTSEDGIACGGVNCHECIVGDIQVCIGEEYSCSDAIRITGEALYEDTRSNYEIALKIKKIMKDSKFEELEVEF